LCSDLDFAISAQGLIKCLPEWVNMRMFKPLFSISLNDIQAKSLFNELSDNRRLYTLLIERFNNLVCLVLTTGNN